MRPLDSRFWVLQLAVFDIILPMKTQPKTTSKTPDISSLSTADLLSMVAGLQQQLASKEDELEQRDQVVKERDRQLQQREQYILLLEEMLRLQRIQRFAASSEKTAHQIHLFDESELEAEIDADYQLRYQYTMSAITACSGQLEQTVTGQYDLVKYIESKSDIEILAIGIGHDVSRYYNKAIKITDVQELGDVMIGQLSGLFENKKKLH